MRRRGVGVDMTALKEGIKLGLRQLELIKGCLDWAYVGPLRGGGGPLYHI